MFMKTVRYVYLVMFKLHTNNVNILEKKIIKKSKTESQLSKSLFVIKVQKTQGYSGTQKE